MTLRKFVKTMEGLIKSPYAFQHRECLKIEAEMDNYFDEIFNPNQDDDMDENEKLVRGKKSRPSVNDQWEQWIIKQSLFAYSKKHDIEDLKWVNKTLLRDYIERYNCHTTIKYQSSGLIDSLRNTLIKYEEIQSERKKLIQKIQKELDIITSDNSEQLKAGYKIVNSK